MPRRNDDGEPVYKHESEMEAAYRSEALKAFRKAAAEGKSDAILTKVAAETAALYEDVAVKMRTPRLEKGCVARSLREWVHPSIQTSLPPRVTLRRLSSQWAATPTTAAMMKEVWNSRRRWARARP